MKLTILETSDTHGFVLPTNYTKKQDREQEFGLARAKAYFDKVIEEKGRENVILIDAGDFLQGSALSNFVYKKQTSEFIQDYADFYNAMDYDFGILGNHDFNFGLDYLNKILAKTNRKFLTANIINKKTKQPFLGQSYQIIERNKIKIGVIGVTTQRIPFWEDQKNIPNLSFISAEEVLKDLVPKIRPEVDLLVVVYHGGFEKNLETSQPTEKFNGENEGYRIVQNIPGIDILLTGHQHRKIAQIVNGVAVVQPGYQVDHVGQVVIDFENETNKIEKIEPSIISTKNFPPAKKMLELTQNLDSQAEQWLDQIIGTVDHDLTFENASEARINGTDYLNFIHQVQLAYTGADISAASILRENVHGLKKEITLRELIFNNPYANEYVKIKITGEQLRQIIEYTGSFLEIEDQKIVFRQKFLEPKYQLYHFDLFYPLEYELNISRPIGQRITKLQFNGQDLVMDQNYTLVVNKFRALGGGNYPSYPDAELVEEYPIDLVTLIENYLQENPQAKVVKTRNYKIIQ